MKIYCCNCEKEVEAREIPATNIYPHRIDLQGKWFYRCTHCSEYVGAKRLGEPLGCIPTPEVRQLRVTIHDRIDSIVEDKSLTTAMVYRYLSEKVGEEFHTGNVKSIEEADRILCILSELYFSLYEESNK